MKTPAAAPETPAERQARQFAQLRGVGDLAMSIAETAGRAALADLEPPPDAESLDDSHPTPASRRRDNALVFTQASSAVRQIITLELRVEAGPAAARQTTAYATPPPDPRRPLLQQVLNDAVRNDPNRARRRREIGATIEQEILEDPDAADLIAETLHRICTKLHIDVDLARVPDEFLDFDEPIKTPIRDKARKPDS